MKNTVQKASSQQRRSFRGRRRGACGQVVPVVWETKKKKTVFTQRGDKGLLTGTDMLWKGRGRQRAYLPRKEEAVCHGRREGVEVRPRGRDLDVRIGAAGEGVALPARAHALHGAGDADAPRLKNVCTTQPHQEGCKLWCSWTERSLLGSAKDCSRGRREGEGGGSAEVGTLGAVDLAAPPGHSTRSRRCVAPRTAPPHSPPPAP